VKELTALPRLSSRILRGPLLREGRGGKEEKTKKERNG